MKQTAIGNATRQRILAYIVAYKSEHDGNSPTIRQIGDACQIASTSSVSHHLRIMAGDSFITFVIGDRNTLQGICVAGGKWEVKG